MSDHVEFNEPKISTTAFVSSGGVGLEGKALGFIRSFFGGLVKNDQQARYILFVVVSILLAISLYYSFMKPGSSEPREVLKSIRN